MSKSEDIQEIVETTAQQKERLLLQCRAYRAGIGHSRRVVNAHLSGDSLARTAIGLVSARAQNAFSNVSDIFNLAGGLSFGKLQKLAPIALSAISLVSRRGLVKPILRGAALVGAVGAGLYMFSRRKKTDE